MSEKEKESVIRRGFGQVAKFCREECATETLKLFNQ